MRAVHDPGIIREVMALVLRRRGDGRDALVPPSPSLWPPELFPLQRLELVKTSQAALT